MRKRKESSNERSLPTTKVKQRTKKEPITIEGYIGIEDGCIVKGKAVFGEGSYNLQGVVEQNMGENKKRIIDGFKLKVTVISADWEKFWTYLWSNPQVFTKHFWSDVIYPAVHELGSKKGARGRSKKSQQLVTWIKEYASFLYAFFSYWFKHPIDEWPDYLKKLITMAEKDRCVIFISSGKGGTNPLIKKLMAKGTNAPYRLTKYCIEKASKEEIEKYGLRLFSEPSYFLKNYIHKNGSATKIAKFFIKGKSPEEMANLAYQLPLKYLFKYLQII